MAKEWTHEKYLEFVEDLKEDLDGLSDGEAADIAGDVLRDEPSLKEFMEVKMGVQDVVGRLATDIC